jgi:methylated-DNA-[protein]-cysteine S-methyltransferase
MGTVTDGERSFRMVEPGGVEPGDGVFAIAELDTPIGPMQLAAADTGLVGCWLRDGRGEPPWCDRVAEPDGTRQSWLSLAAEELDGYFLGELCEFTVPIDLRFASAFDRTVLAGLADVRYGRTTSYGELAASVGMDGTAARQVGRAMGANPVRVVVPCHRVVGADGSLVGYAAGLTVKRRLLDLESMLDTPRLDLGL